MKQELVLALTALKKHFCSTAWMEEAGNEKQHIDELLEIWDWRLEGQDPALPVLMIGFSPRLSALRRKI